MFELKQVEQFSRILTVSSWVLCLSIGGAQAQSGDEYDKALEDCRKSISSCHVFECEGKTYTCSAGDGVSLPSCQGGETSWPQISACNLVPKSHCEAAGWEIFKGKQGVSVRPTGGKGPRWASGRLDHGKDEDELRCGDDIRWNERYVTIRHGRNLDLLWFVGFSGEKAVVHFARLQDGRHHGVQNTPSGSIIKLGRKKDVKIKFCFDGSRWNSSNVSRANVNLWNGNIEWKPDFNTCTGSPISFFNGGTVRR